MDKLQFLERLARFCDDSLQWCANESAQATGRVMTTLEYLLADAARVVDKDERAAYAELKAELGSGADKRHDSAAVLTRLEASMSQKPVLRSVALPVVQALTFARRLDSELRLMRLLTQEWCLLRTAAMQTGTIDRAAVLAAKTRLAALAEGTEEKALVADFL